MKTLGKKLKTLAFFSLAFVVALYTLSHIYFARKNTTVRIGSKSCTEQLVLSHLLAGLIEKRTDLKTKTVILDGTSICFNALKSGSIDLYFEYTGTALYHILKEPMPPDEPLYPYVKQAFIEKFGITWLCRLGFENQYCLITRSNSPYKKLSDLTKKTKYAVDAEFSIRDEFRLLQKNYSVAKKPKLLDQVILYLSLENKAIDVISGFSTDGRLYGSKFRILEDDKKCMPKYEVAPILKKSTLEKHPELNNVCALLYNAINEEEMRKMVYLIEFENVSLKKLAAKKVEELTCML